ncbi:ExbD/TolR family protein [Tahibacter amnicola]|uniref:Biopolymer transporter ExbD n=1 Tax=Tahibacter amnicola TaxID=2976241 RepID=A0ABY6BC48_9GAMM|nr:biopolymer transporter ExbD [Tahibacter amnicola]UXI66748.1 biopolymer transporter ExbD [Tahibacter amnicola]
MRLGASRREDEFEINVIPLIDVMLTLLMFFVLTATFEQRARLKVTLPQASEPVEASQDLSLTIQIDADGRYYIDNNEVLNASVDTLKDALQQVAGDDRSRPVTIRADARTPHQSVVTVMDALGQTGFTRMSIATTPSTDPAKGAPKK